MASKLSLTDSAAELPPAADAAGAAEGVAGTPGTAGTADAPARGAMEQSDPRLTSNRGREPILINMFASW